MVPLNRCAGLIYTMSGIKLSEATCLKYIGQAYHSLDSWEDFGKEYLLTCPALHVDETGFRVNNKNWWLHVATDGLVALKYLHRKRGKEAMDDFGIIPFYTGTLIHDRWASYFTYDKCTHQVCGSHLLRDLTFIFFRLHSLQLLRQVEIIPANQRTPVWANRLLSVLSTGKNS